MLYAATVQGTEQAGKLGCRDRNRVRATADADGQLRL